MAIELHFAGIGAARAGTTAMTSILSSHPEVFCPPKKELHYFNSDRLYREDLQNLDRFFEAAQPGQKLGEFTPRYAISEQALLRLDKHFPALKVIFILRDPVKRAFSQYQYFRSTKGKGRSDDFVTSLEGPFREGYLGKSLYSPQLERIMRIFGRARSHLVLFEDLVSKARRDEVYSDLFRFLGVDDGFRPAFADEKRNSSYPVNSSLVAGGRRLATRLDAGKGSAGRTLLARPLNATLDRMAPLVAAKSTLDPATRSAVFDRYFRADVEDVANVYGLDVSAWWPEPRTQ